MRHVLDKRFLYALPLLLILIGCDQGPGASPTSPTTSPSSPAPSPPPPSTPSPTPATASSTIAGMVVSPATAPSGISRAIDAKPTMVAIVDTNISSPISSSGAFTLMGTTGSEPRLRFTGSGIDATLKLSGISPGQTVTITVLVTATSAVLQSPPHGENKVELEGLIEAIQSSSRSFTLQGRTVRVDDATEIRHGDRLMTFADLHTGDRVHVRGTPDGANVLASLILLQNPEGPGPGPAPSPQPQPNRVEVRGAIAGLSGTCPTRSFTIGSQTVSTNGSTRFDHTSCANLSNGLRVEVEGIRQSDGSVLAQKIDAENEIEENKAEVEGTVSALTGTCPAVSFTVSSRHVVTNSSTQFEKMGCGDLRGGVKVEVQGTRQADGSILAARVKRED